MAWLGSLYSNHNHLDEADAVLSRALTLQPEDPLVLAFYSANQSKKAGAMMDFSMGIYKLNKLQDAIDGLNKAVELAPQDMFVRISRLITFGFLGDINSDFDKVFEDEQWVMEHLTGSNVQLPNEVYQSVYVALANAYKVKADSGEQSALVRSKDYLNKLEPIGGCPDLSLTECQKLTRELGKS
nr:hypothetical protein [Pleionea sp. CnH1-48]